MDHQTEQLERVGVLGEPLRRSLYAHVVGQPDAVSREQAAHALELPVHTARFHLDRLVEAGLLEVEFRQLSGRRGPGSGRPTKFYRRSPRQLAVSLPERRYDLAGEVLAGAVDRSARAGAPVADVLPEVAREVGRRLGADARSAHVDDAPADADADADQSRRDGTGPLGDAAGVLRGLGYEPLVAEDEVCLANCPFDRLAAEHTDLVCGMNRDLVAGVLEGAELPGLAARLAPHDGLCCVRVAGAQIP